MTCRLSFYCNVGKYSTFLYHMYAIAFLTQTDSQKITFSNTFVQNLMYTTWQTCSSKQQI